MGAIAAGASVAFGDDSAAAGAGMGGPRSSAMSDPLAAAPVRPSAEPVRPIPTLAPNLRVRLEEARRQTKANLDSLRDRARLMAEEVELLEDVTERAFNPYWGSVLREGNENSRFGEQCGDYADLYTSRVSNFLSYSPLRYFRAPRRAMPHEL